LGGEELKISIFALILLVAGFLVQIQSISAQEEPVPAQEETVSREEQLRAEELAASQDAPLATDDEDAPAVRTGSSVWPIIRMILVLALCAAAVYGIVFFLKRAKKQTVSKDPFLKILATVHLGVNRYAHIVSVGGKAWLLGSSDGGVNLIGEVDDKEIIDSMLLEESKRSAEPQGRFPDFISMLRRLGLPAQPGASGSGASKSVDDIRKHRDRLKGL
jgi:flagellar protein FliO/FliZ